MKKVGRMDKALQMETRFDGKMEQNRCTINENVKNLNQIFNAQATYI